MTIIFGTLGFTPKKLLPSVAAHENVERLVFYHDRHDASRAAATQVLDFCAGRDLPATPVELDAFDIIECALRMRNDLRAAGLDRVVFNVTGGTPVISSAATLTCILEGVRAVYVDERTWEQKSLPLLSIRYDQVLAPEPRRVLRYVYERGERGCAQADIMAALGLTRGTVSYHVTNLKDRHLLLATPDPDDRRRERLRVLESAALLLAEAPP